MHLYACFGGSTFLIEKWLLFQLTKWYILKHFLTFQQNSHWVVTSRLLWTISLALQGSIHQLTSDKYCISLVKSSHPPKRSKDYLGSINNECWKIIASAKKRIFRKWTVEFQLVARVRAAHFGWSQPQRRWRLVFDLLEISIKIDWRF